MKAILTWTFALSLFLFFALLLNTTVFVCSFINPHLTPNSFQYKVSIKNTFPNNALNTNKTTDKIIASIAIRFPPNFPPLFFIIVNDKIPNIMPIGEDNRISIADKKNHKKPKITLVDSQSPTEGINIKIPANNQPISHIKTGVINEAVASL